MDTFDPDSCELSEAADALRNLGSVSSAGFGKPQRPRYRLFKPNEEWQRNLRKVARLRIDGYRSDTLPNDDGVPYTLCSVLQNSKRGTARIAARRNYVPIIGRRRPSTSLAALATLRMTRGDATLKMTRS